MIRQKMWTHRQWRRLCMGRCHLHRWWTLCQRFPFSTPVSHHQRPVLARHTWTNNGLGPGCEGYQWKYDQWHRNHRCTWQEVRMVWDSQLHQLWCILKTEVGVWRTVLLKGVVNKISFTPLSSSSLPKFYSLLFPQPFVQIATLIFLVSYFPLTFNTQLLDITGPHFLDHSHDCIKPI